MTVIQNTTLQPNYVTLDNTNLQKKSLLKEATGLAAGSVAAFAVGKGASIALRPMADNFKSTVDSFHLSNSETMMKEAERMVKESGIASKGFRGITIYDVSTPAKIEQAMKHFNRTTNAVIGNSSVINKIKLTSLLVLNKFAQIPNLLIGKLPNLKAKAKNNIVYGGFMSFTNSVLTGRSTSLFHEIGHAINKNKSFLTRLPLRLSLISSCILTPLAILTALFHKNKQVKAKSDVNNETKSFLSKTKDFVKNHFGLTMFGLSLPLLIEEGTASLRAVKFANKSTLMTNLMKKEHNKLLLMAFGSYVAGSAITIATAKTAAWVKNKITGEK